MTGSKSTSDKKPAGDPYAKISKTQTRNRNTGPIIIGATVAVVVVIGLIVVLASRGGGDDKVAADTGAAAAKNASQETATVTVSGEDLPEYPADAGTPLLDPSKDPAVGLEAPKLEGQSFDGSKITIDPADGTPKVIIFVAHWCPHCQAEVPLIQSSIEKGNLPDGVEIYTVSTSVDQSKPNYPPSKWLAKVGWQPQVLLDDAGGTAAQTFALPGYPYFVMTDGQGKVVQRGSGEAPIEDFEAAVNQLAATSGSTTTAPATAN